MSVTVLYFAAARERAGLSRESLDVPPGARVSDVLALLASKHPPLAPLLPHLRVAVQQQFVGLDSPVAPDAELALIPPVAGGAPSLFSVVGRPLQLAEVVDAVASRGAGGLVTFSGAVRDQTKGRRVLRLEYEAYAPMAEAKLTEIGDEVARTWPGTRLAIMHRVGTLVPGELAVVIAAASAHRKEAFLGCEYAIERLKQDVPIWKKEYFDDGEVWVGLGP
ncbi:molybdenum cofactor biosynthesis protein MoaE [Corallococcus sp. AB032C]|uniref:molybdenum cofactor biosynthesis protein n=1 Tax=Corallococcus TaxID=83461 RepID=UPI000EC74178|nr:MULTISPECIES: molybdenum cofactor biosynthesis protein MoaE [Corallococcus]NNB88441.1 molybdenum cofactor biosynthesis protein MoaE [Corallococcus exiguus]NPC51906.1 molybdenum cofactor biosynthesis protein MoaE [Corallococcus exiguus]RKH77381.1 molybdenum cofactor biosynthesis protein MoaE [Corallococcus sp. AB032C]